MNIQNIKEFLGNFFFEEGSSCPVCGKVLLFENNVLCSKCQRKLNVTLENTCPKCGRKLPKGEMDVCSSCKKGKSLLRKCISLYDYDAFAKRIVHAFKYENNIKLGENIGVLLGEKLKLLSFEEKVDIILPVPLHKNRLLERGFNQSEIISQKVSEVLGIPCDFTALERVKETADQTHLSKMQRSENVKDAFLVANKNKIHEKRVLVIDDVLTTGATMEECAAALIGHGATCVYGATIASTNF